MPDAAATPPAGQAELFGLGGLSAGPPERVPIRVRSSLTLSGWRLEVTSDQGAGAIVLVETERRYYRGEGVLLGWTQERLASLYEALLPRPDKRPFETPQLG